MLTSPSFEFASTEGPPALPYGGRLMFTQSWEDPECDLRALSPRPGETLLTITSGGDNALQFLLSDVERVLAIDLNPTQNYLLQLKQAAFRRLEHAELLELLGVRASSTAWAHYQRLRSTLPHAAREFWDSRPEWFARGLLTQGGFERYFAVLRKALKLLVGSAAMRGVFSVPTDAQASYYDQHWNTWRYRSALKLLCSKWFLSRRLDPSWFQDTEDSRFGEHFVDLARHALAELPAQDNYFLSQILLGRYQSEQAVPAYLRAENFELIRERLPRLSIHTLDVQAALAQQAAHSVDCFALSNVFEYAPEVLFSRSKAELVRCARPGARLCLRNLVAPRRLELDARFAVDAALSAALQAADRAFIYARFEAARISVVGKAAP